MRSGRSCLPPRSYYAATSGAHSGVSGQGQGQGLTGSTAHRAHGPPHAPINEVPTSTPAAACTQHPPRPQVSFVCTKIASTAAVGCLSLSESCCNSPCNAFLSSCNYCDNSAVVIASESSWYAPRDRHGTHASPHQIPHAQQMNQSSCVSSQEHPPPLSPQLSSSRVLAMDSPYSTHS